jgi:hypothetical protein
MIFVASPNQVVQVFGRTCLELSDFVRRGAWRELLSPDLISIWYAELNSSSACKRTKSLAMRNLGAGESSSINTSGGTTAVSQSRPLAAIFWGGLFAGAFDLTQAFIGFGLLGATPYRILQHIAGGIFGTRSYQMGSMSAAIGFLLHFTIAFTAATIYYLSSRKIRVLVEHSIICGLLYGEAVFLSMYFAVLPLSALGPSQFNIATYITGPIGHPLLVGLPIALSVRRFADHLNGSSNDPLRNVSPDREVRFSSSGRNS